MCVCVCSGEGSGSYPKLLYVTKLHPSFVTWDFLADGLPQRVTEFICPFPWHNCLVVNGGTGRRTGHAGCMVRPVVIRGLRVE